MIAYDASATPAEFVSLGHAVEATELVVPIAATFPLGQASQAHARIERGDVLGRIILKIR
jgi:D-arabinose 1-dehydrogenase-like Zn-dependent alcohol dehydrogenase